jgi:hypothetical protein
MVDVVFPHEGALCERCGYPLQGLPAAGFCPECGSSIDDSSPRHRPGLPWQQQPTLLNWLRTQVKCLVQPRQAFRQLSVDTPIARDRLAMLLQLGLMGLAWAAIWHHHGRANPILWAMPAMGAVWLLNWIEALGVAWFSRQKGFAVPLRLAERLVAYATVGWWPAVLILADLLGRGGQHPLWQLWPTAFLGPLDPVRELLTYLLVTALSILGFETLVWVGVRQCRYANSRQPPP